MLFLIFLFAFRNQYDIIESAHGQRPRRAPQGRAFPGRLFSAPVFRILCVHKCYEGKTGAGLDCILTGGRFAAGWFVDGIALRCRPLVLPPRPIGCISQGGSGLIAVFLDFEPFADSKGG